MNILDIILICCLGYGFFKGFSRGFIVSVGSLIGLVAGVYLAIKFSHLLAAQLAAITNLNQNIITLLAFAITFITVVFLVAQLAKILTKLIHIVALGLVNKLAGALFMSLLVAFFISVILMYFSSFDQAFSILPENQKQNALLFEPIKQLAPAILPDLIKEYQSLINN